MYRPARLIPILAGLLIFLGGPSLVRFYTDWLWFGEVGYQSVYATMLRSQGTLFTIAFAAAFAFLAFNLRLALAAIGDIRPVFTTREGLEVPLPGRQQLRTLALLVAAVLAIFVGLFAAGRWEIWQSWKHAVPFGQADPILGRDVGFYVFSLPFLAIRPRRRADAGGHRGAGVGRPLPAVRQPDARASPPGCRCRPRRDGTCRCWPPSFSLLLAFGAWLQRSEYLVTASGMIYGASYADVNGRMPASLLLLAACLIGAGLAGVQAFSYRNWPIPAAIGLYLVVSIGGEVYSTMLQRFVVTPNEQVREAPYIQHNIEATRRAFGLDRRRGTRDLGRRAC